MNDYLTARTEVQRNTGIELNKEYRLPNYRNCYFLIREHLFSRERHEWRVCLYQENCTTKFPFTEASPGELWITNENIGDRTVNELFRDMTSKIEYNKITVK